MCYEGNGQISLHTSDLDYCCKHFQTNLSQIVRAHSDKFAVIHLSFVHQLYLDLDHNIVELQWLEHLWNHENMFATAVVRANEY